MSFFLLTHFEFINQSLKLFSRQELLEDAIQNNRPFPTWDGATVVAWLEVRFFVEFSSIFGEYV